MRTLLSLFVATALAAAQDSGVPDSARQTMREQGPGLEAGKDAVDFKLLRLQDDPKAKAEHVQLSDFKGKRPVVLIFGSYT